MLQLMRDKMAGWLTWFFIIILVLVFALFGLGYYFNSNSSDSQMVAKVNSQPVTLQQVQRVYQGIRQQQQLQGLNAKQQEQLMTEATQEVIAQVLIHQDAHRMGMGVAGKDIDAMLYKMPAFQDNGQFSTERYQAILQQMGMTTEALKMQLAVSVMTQQFRQGLIDSGFALDSEVKRFAAYQHQARHIRYLVVPHTLLKGQVSGDADAIEQYYQAHQKDFYSQPKVKLAYIELSLRDVMSSIKVTPEQVKDFYQAHQASFPGGMKQQAVKTALIKSLAQEKYGELGDRLANLTFENPDSLSFAANELGLKLHTTDWASQSGGYQGLLKNKKVREAAFSDMVLHQGNNSDVINLTPERAVVVRVAQYQPAKLKPLADVKQEIMQRLQQNSEAAYAKRLAEDWKKQIIAGHMPPASAAGHALAWHQVKALKWDDKHLPAEVVQAAFNQFVPSQTHPVDPVIVVVKNKTYLLQLLAVNTPNSVALSSDEHGALNLLLARAWSAQLYQDYFDALQSNADIQYLHKHTS